MPTLTDTILANPDLTAADTAAAYNADPSGWRPVPAFRVIAWMGEAARIAKLEMLVAAVAAKFPDEENPPTPNELGLYSAVRSVFLGASNTDTVVDMFPASPHRQLLAGLVAASVLTAGDAAALVSRGRPDGWVDATAADVAAARATLARRAAADATLTALAAYESYVRDAANRYAAGEAVDLPEVPAVPGGGGA